MMNSKAVVRNSAHRFNQVQEFLSSKYYLEACRNNPTAFTRQRKLSLEPLVLSIINRKGVTLAMEIRRFYNVFKPDGKETISAPGYLKQRMKLNPKAFSVLNDYHLTNFYRDEMDSLVRMKGYFLFAVDGSKVNTPNTPENQEYFGTQANHSGHQCQAGLSCCYDVLNTMALDCTINHITFNEKDQVEKHIDKVHKIIGDQPYIIILDRGYPSSFLFIDRIEANQKFVVRLSSAVYKHEQQNMPSDDEEVVIQFTNARINPYRNTPCADRLREKGSIKMRLVKIVLPGDTVEVLATNLSKDEFSAQEIGHIYKLRWGVETAYDTLKNKFMLENFTGRKPILIEQDILSTVYLYNLTADMVRDAQKEQLQRNRLKKYKHQMKININISIGIIKEDLIRMALEQDNDKRGMMFKDIIDSISRNLIPVRENRKFPRKKTTRHYKDSSRSRRSF